MLLLMRTQWSRIARGKGEGVVVYRRWKLGTRTIYSGNRYAQTEKKRLKNIFVAISFCPGSSLSILTVRQRFSAGDLLFPPFLLLFRSNYCSPIFFFIAVYFYFFFFFFWTNISAEHDGSPVQNRSRVINRQRHRLVTMRCQSPSQAVSVNVIIQRRRRLAAVRAIWQSPVMMSRRLSIN